MIVAEYLNNETLIKHYSDQGMMLLQLETGHKYSEAIDIVPCLFTYIETEEPIYVEEKTLEETDTLLEENE